MPPLVRAWPISGSLGVASGSTSRSPSKPPSPVVARPTPSQVRQPSRLPPCGSTTDRHHAAPRQDARATSPEDRVSGSLPTRRCGGAYRREPRALRHYNGRAIVRSIVRQTPSSPILARWCDHAPVARSPGSAVTPWHPEIQHTVLPAPPHSNACRPLPCVQSPRLIAIQPICFARPRESPLQRRVNQPETVLLIANSLACAFLP